MPTRRKRKAEETSLSKAIQATLTAKGCRVIRIQSGIVPALYGATKRFIHCAPAGTPDLLVIRPATSVTPLATLTFIEVKKKTGKQTEAQSQWDTWAKLSGVRSFVVRGVGEALAAVFGSRA